MEVESYRTPRDGVDSLPSGRLINPLQPAAHGAGALDELARPDRSSRLSGRPLGGQDHMKNALPALAGLTVAWGGTALLLSPADRLLGAPDRLATKLLGPFIPAH